MIISLSMSELPSRYPIGAEVYFHPDGWTFQYAGRPLNQALKAKVTSVRFTDAKVLYDLALLCRQTDSQDRFYDEYYEAIPLRDVDSTFVFRDDTISGVDQELVARLAALPAAFIPEVVDEPSPEVAEPETVADVPAVPEEKRVGFFKPSHIFNPDTFDRIFKRSKPISLEKSAPIRLSL